MHRKHRKLTQKHYRAIETKISKLRALLCSLLVPENEVKLVDLVCSYADCITSIRFPEIKGRVLVNQILNWNPTGLSWLSYPYLFQVDTTQSHALRMCNLISQASGTIFSDSSWCSYSGSLWLAQHTPTNQDIAVFDHGRVFEVVNLETCEIIKTSSDLGMELLGGEVVSKHSLYWFCSGPSRELLLLSCLRLRDISSFSKEEKIVQWLIDLEQRSHVWKVFVTGEYVCCCQGNVWIRQEREEEPDDDKRLSDREVWLWKLPENLSNCPNSHFMKDNATILHLNGETIDIWIEGNWLYRHSRSPGRFLETYVLEDLLRNKNALIQRRVSVDDTWPMGPHGGLFFLYEESSHRLRILH